MRVSGIPFSTMVKSGQIQYNEKFRSRSVGSLDGKKIVSSSCTADAAVQDAVVIEKLSAASV